MSKIKFITDSTAYIDTDFINKHNIDIIPLSVNFEGSVEDEGLPGEFDVFFKRLSSSTDFPTTSQPPVGRFIDTYKKALEAGYEVIAIIMSSKLSGTFNSAITAANMVSSSKISVIDSLTSVANLSFLIRQGIILSEKGASRKEIVDAIEEQKKNMGIRLTVASLDYLKKGGRLSSAEATIGSLLNIKPIIGLIDGELKALTKVRGKKKAMEKMIQDIPSNAHTISISHVGTPDEALKYKNKVKKLFPDSDINIYEIGPVIGSHLGPEGIGFCYFY